MAMLDRMQRANPFFEDRYYGSMRGARSLRKLVEIIDQRHSTVSITGLLLHTVMETLSIALYVWTSQVSKAQSVKHFRWNLPVFIVEVVLNIIFLLEWVALLFFEQDRRRYLISWLSLTNAMTSIPMIILGIGSLANRAWRFGWVPMYLRVWWLNDCLSVLLDYPELSRYVVDIYRQIARYFIRLFAVMCTCIGTVQMVESCTGDYIDIYNTTYMMVVAFSTIGFGDVVVRSTPARLFMIVFLIIGICYFLPFFSQLSAIRQKRWQYRSYRAREWGLWKRRYVIICGIFSDLAVDVLLRNFYAGWRKYLDVRIILMSPTPHSTKVALTVNLPWLRDRVKLMIGDPTNPLDLRRADARNAEAIFLFGNARSFSYYHDYTIIEQSMAVGAYDPNLPQHLLLRRSRATRDVLPYAASVLELERLIRHMLGLSMVCPGTIPLIINLLRTYEPMPLDITLNRNWVDEYEYSLRNDIYEIKVPDTLREKGFHELARDFFEKNVTIIGVLDQHGRVQLNPRQDITDAQRYIVIAKTRRIAEEATEAIAQENERVFGEEMLSVARSELFSSVADDTSLTHSSSPYYVLRNAHGEPVDPAAYLHSHHEPEYYAAATAASGTHPRRGSPVSTSSPRQGNEKRNRHHSPTHTQSPQSSSSSLYSSSEDEGEDEDEGGPSRADSAGSVMGPDNPLTMQPTANAAAAAAEPRALMLIEDAYDLVDHFVFIDLSPAKTPEKESRFSHDATRLSVAHDMVHLMIPVRQAYPLCDMVLLTDDLSFAPYFEHYWPHTQDANPVKYIVGCGLNTADLRRCNLPECAGTCIFFAGDISAAGSTSAMAMLVVRSIHYLLQRVPDFPVVVELEGLIKLALFPPYAEDPHLRQKAEVDFVFEPNFLIGNALSRLMLYPSLQRNFFTLELTNIIDVLVSGHNTETSALASMPLKECDGVFDTYEDVINFALKHGFLPIALNRSISDPANMSLNRKHFVLTNPPRFLPVNQNEDAFFYITPGLPTVHRKKHHQHQY